LRTCGSLAPKKRMENLQMRNSQIAIAEIWDTLFNFLCVCAFLSEVFVPEFFF
jgi:hypothetical protein